MAAPVEARWWVPEAGGRLRCTLCPRACRLADGQRGFCFVRERRGDRLLATAFGRVTGLAVDPVEKKPLYHYRPGAGVLSFGTPGCNLACRFCQNWDLSRARLDEARAEAVTPAALVALARAEGADGVAFTYNDPIVWAELAVAVAEAARAAGLFTVFVTNGYVSPEARAEIFPYMDAANVDLKAFTERFYAKLTGAHLAPVLDTLEWLAADGRTWVEVTNLLIPGENDDPAETARLAGWVRERMGPDVPLHLTAFHPAWKLLDRPRTPPATLRRARAVARAQGLRHVYTGNVRDREGGTTTCTACGTAVVERDGFAVTALRLAGGACARCGTRLAGVFEGARAGSGAITRVAGPPS